MITFDAARAPSCTIRSSSPIFSISQSGAGRRQSFGLKSPGAADGRDTGVPCSLNIHTAVAHHQRILARQFRLFEQRENTNRIRLLLPEAVSAVDLEKPRMRRRAHQ